jgi:hypothetical protein
MHLARPEHLVDNEFHDIDGKREAKTHRSGLRAGSVQRGVDADDLAIQVEQRST